MAGVDPVAAQVGHLSGSLVGGQAFGQAAQVLDQHHPQRGGQGPDLAQRELATLLVGRQEVQQQFFIEGAVAVGHEGPGDAVHAWQAGQRLVQQHRQGTVVVARQPLVHRLELRLDQVEVVEQPLVGRTDLMATAGLCADESVGFAQHPDVAAQAREEGDGAPGRRGGPVRGPQAATMGGQAQWPEDLGAQRGQQQTA